MPDPTDRPPDLSPAELEALLGRGSLDRWQALSDADRNRLTRDLEALQRTAREIANATRQLHDGLAGLELDAAAPDPAGRPRAGGDPVEDRRATGSPPARG